jgi:lipoprotein-anchoring transpeptidase ErfK/SrfK
MRSVTAFVAFSLSMGVAHAATMPDLTREGIDQASFEDWDTQRRPAQERKAQYDAAVLDAKAAEKDAPQEVEFSDEEKALIGKPDPFLVRVQVLLDRAHMSPGVIDGYLGSNLDKAVRAFETTRRMQVDGKLDAEVWKALSSDTAPVMKDYEVTKKDAGEKYVDEIPTDYAKMAKMKRLAYHGPAEMFGERFHMDEDLLKELNLKASLGKSGSTILVADTGADPEIKVMRIEVDKSEGELTAFDGAGNVVATYPATIGSTDTPSPEGEVTVERFVEDPGYTYNPKINFKQGKNDEILELPPGPNGPVGSMWIDLSKPTYGIHGTPEPSRIDKANSHGCVRLTNWDAEALARIVEPKVTKVIFKD